MAHKTAWLVPVLLVGVYPLFASTYYVGTCKSGSFPTISAAVDSPSVAPGSTINVCPGNYQEQVIISKPLTLHGITANGSSGVYINAPATLAETESAVLIQALAPMVWVTAGPVNIQDISVVLTEGTSPCPSPQLVGFYYASGASGTLNRVEFQATFDDLLGDDKACPGYGIWVENANPAPTSVTISNSFSDGGILAAALEPLPDIRLKVTITGNQALANPWGGDAGIFVSQVSGTVTGNFIRPRRGPKPYFGINDAAPNVTVSGNTIVGDDLGDAAGTQSGVGVLIDADGAIVKPNKITGLEVGIDLGCHSAVVTGNTIMGAFTGLGDPLASFTGSNSFFTTQENVRSSCP
jgi:hypothetical protein